MLFRNWVWTLKSAADRPLGNLVMRTRMVAPCENSLRLTGRVMDAKSSLDHCAIPAEPPYLRFPRPTKRWTGDGRSAARACPLPEPVEGFGKLSHRKLTLPETTRCPSLSRALASSATGNLRCPSLRQCRVMYFWRRYRGLWLRHMHTKQAVQAGSAIKRRCE